MIVNVLFEHDAQRQPHGCSHIRLLRPLGHPTVQGSLELVASTALADQKADVVVVERWWKPGLNELEAQRLVAQIKARGSRFVYTLDDNLLDLDQDEEGVAVPEATKRCVRLFARECDLLIVSTETLAARFSRLARWIAVIPNALDERLFGLRSDDPAATNPVLASGDGWKAPRVEEERVAELHPVKIGFMGTLSHDADLQLILEPLRRILNDYGDGILFELIGGISGHRFLRSLPPDRVRVLHPGAAVHYDRFIPWMRTNALWDIGLAPLTERPFNRFKSDIKFLDYAALGIPGIYSRFGPYERVVQAGVTGLTTENDPDAWYQAMRRLIDDPDLRYSLAVAARGYLVRNGRLLHDAATQWIEALRNLPLA